LKLELRFVELFPAELEDGVLYISILHAVAEHTCCCGCGHRVTTPLSPTDWSLTFDGKTVSLHPSIGNWSFPCQSHYWIRRNEIIWARRFSPAEIQVVRARDRAAKEVPRGSVRQEAALGADEGVRGWGSWLRTRILRLRGA
jgi:hypothetical protein